MSRADATPSSSSRLAPRARVEHDADGRLVIDAVDESRARALAKTSNSDALTPLLLIIEFDVARGLPRDVRRACATCEIAPGPLLADGASFATQEDAPVTRANERQRRRSAAARRRRRDARDDDDGSNDDDDEDAIKSSGDGRFRFKTSFACYVTRASPRDVARVSTFRAARSGEERDAYPLGSVELSVRRAIEGDYEEFTWMPATHERRARENLGTFTWCAHFDHEREGVLRVRCESARRVKAGDSNGLSDPYVVVTLHRVNESKERLAGIVRAEEQRRRDGVEDEEDTDEGEARAADWRRRFFRASSSRTKDVRRTKTVRRTLDPVWNERFTFTRVDRRSDSYLTFELYDADVVGEDDLLSQTAIRVRELAAARPTDARAAARETPWRQIPSKLEPAGALNVVAYFEDDERTDLRVCVKRADDVSACDVFGTSDVFVEATCGETTFRTKVCENTTSPVWDHWLRFEVTGRETSREELDRGVARPNRALEFRLFHVDARTREGVFLGQARVSLHRTLEKSRGGHARSHWLSLVDADVDVNVADFRVRARLEDAAPAARPRRPEEGVIDKAKAFARQTYDATRARARRAMRDREKDLETSAAERELAIHDRLTSIIEGRLREFQWPDRLVGVYARAYAACCDDPWSLPPPPDGMRVPPDVARMFDAVAFSRVELE